MDEPWAIVVTWNERDDALNCLASLEASRPQPHVVLVDNASRDGTAAAVAERFPGIEILAQPRNLDFAAGANAGLRRALAAGAAWVWVLNADTRVEPDALAELLRVAEGDPRIAIAGPRLVHPGGREVVGALCDFARGAVREPSVGPEAPPLDVDYVWGCALLARGAVLREIGLFDESYVAYFEDADLCLRAKRAGYRVVGVPAARVCHAGGRAFDRAFVRQTYLRGRNWLRCFARHAPSGQRLAAVLAVAFLRLPPMAWSSARYYLARRLRPGGRQVSLG